MPVMTKSTAVKRMTRFMAAKEMIQSKPEKEITLFIFQKVTEKIPY